MQSWRTSCAAARWSWSQLCTTPVGSLPTTTTWEEDDEEDEDENEDSWCFVVVVFTIYLTK